ncbi:MAG: hypothetical protein JSV84_01420 [Gemmatimonadota bacterium]|nr:MAG: hypothetical protein JSV84_01420 [Gemmatimonadota bacterium]
MNVGESINLRVRKLGLVDVKLAQGCAIFLTLIIVKLLPEIMNISIWWFIGLLFLCAIKPIYTFIGQK